MSKKSVNPRHRINWLILLMSLSLLGISGIQAYWLARSYQLEEEKFDQAVADALQQVSHRLEALEAIGFLNENLRMEPIFTARASDMMKLDRKRDSGLRLTSAEGAYRVKVLFGDDSIHVYEKTSESSPGLFYANRDTNYRISLSDPQKLFRRSRTMDAVFNQLILRTFQESSGGIKRLSQKHLDSILDFEMRSGGINLPYEYAVLNQGERIIQSEGWDTARVHRHQAALFPNDFFGNSRLLVNFPDKTRYLLSAIWLTLLISLLFTLSIIYTFWRSLRYSLQQKRINDIKTDFINNMTHEFKTPIATINLAIDALRNPRVISDRQRVQHYSELIKQENARMNLQVESVLRMALMDKKELELDMKNISLTVLLESCVQHIRLALESRGGRIRCDWPEEDVLVRADPQHLRSAIVNLLDNAVKYSLEAPRIALILRIEQDELVLEVADQGIGMTREEQKKIFDRFYRVASGNVHNIKGHGLGLSYARGIVEAHGGRIEVESEKHRGSRFFIHLPKNAEDEH